MTQGQASWNEELLLVMERNGYTEETYFTFSYSPVVEDSGEIKGVFCACTEDTRRVLGERRLRTLRELAAAATEAKTAETACELSARSLSQNSHDLPFALIYLLDEAGTQAKLTGITGLAGGTPASPELVEIGDPRTDLWGFSFITSSKSQIVKLVPERFGLLPGGPWSESPNSAIVLPLAATSQDCKSGFLVAGISSRREFDDDYQGFLDLVAGQISTAIADAHAYEAERKRAEALAELDRAKTIFFSNVSHEFRTPLTLMLGPTEDALTDEQNLLPPVQRERIEIVQRNGLRLLKLVNTLLDFSRIEAGRIQAVYEPIDLATFTAELASTFRSLIERAGMCLVVDCPPLPEAIYVDCEMWEKIILNLLSNAFKFTFNGTITVRQQYCKHHIELSVTDTGIGIPEDEIPHLFERFHRVKGAQGRSFEGSGIGLSLVQELVKLHGGSVNVTSMLAQGSCFTVSIPVGCTHLPPERIGASRSLVSTAMSPISYVEEAWRWLPKEVGKQNFSSTHTSPPNWGNPPTADASVTPRTSAFLPNSARILVVDDNADMRDYLYRLLSQRYEVETVEDGIAAIAVIQQSIPDLVLTDVMMPRLDGFRLLQALRNEPQTQNLPIILLSARAGEESRIEGLEAGADDYLIKPFSARELLARVEANLKMAQMRQEAAVREQELRLAAETANRIKDEFLAVLSHELRSPLNPILGWSKLLQSGRLSAAKTAEALSTIERNAKLQSQLIEDLLDVSRILRGKLSLSLAPVNLTTVITDALNNVRLAAKAKSIEIEIQLNSETVYIRGDSARLQQIFWNLLSNAVKFTSAGGKVVIRLESVDYEAHIQVIDTGKGISPDFLPYVFDYFRQEDSATTRKFGGLGLGLAIVKQLVELHGGSIHVDSLGEGYGATFTVKLPLIKDEFDTLSCEGSLSCLTKANSRFNEIEILIVDDEADSRELIAFVLEQAGIKTIQAASAIEALTFFEQSKPDLLISDIGMPDMDGYSLLQTIRSWLPEQGGQIPAIALTAYAGQANAKQAIAAGFERHIPKPIDPDALLSVITDLLLSIAR
jgi:signal transduction histidine kinase